MADIEDAEKVRAAEQCKHIPRPTLVDALSGSRGQLALVDPAKNRKV